MARALPDAESGLEWRLPLFPADSPRLIGRVLLALVQCFEHANRKDPGLPESPFAPRIALGRAALRPCLPDAGLARYAVQYPVCSGAGWADFVDAPGCFPGDGAQRARPKLEAPGA